MSADCCCDRSECNPTISACCLPTEDGKGTCEQLTDCECRKRGGLWRDPADHGVSPVPCERCYICRCCGYEPNDGVYRWRGTRFKRHIFDATPCPSGTSIRWMYDPYPDANGNCPSDCNVLCKPETGACCYDCGCAEGLTQCACTILQRNTGPGNQASRLLRVGETCADGCAVCACINGSIVDVPSYHCSQAYLSSSEFSAYSCAELQANPLFWQEFVSRCANSVPPGGGGGPIGPPVSPPIPPRPYTPPPPPKPCTRPPVYNPMCSYKVWFMVLTERYEDPCRDYTRERISLVAEPNLANDACDTLSCCGAPAPDCKDVENVNVRRILQDVDCDPFIGTYFYSDDFISLTCNSEQEIYRYTYQCPVCPDSETKKQKIVCNTAQFLRGCCDTNMNFLSVRIPDTGTKINGTWQGDYKPAYTIVLDLRDKVCVGYDRNHPSCK